MTLYITEHAIQWQSLVQGMATGLFNDSETLGLTIDKGTMFYIKDSISALNHTQIIALALIMNAMPLIWTGTGFIVQTVSTAKISIGSTLPTESLAVARIICSRSFSLLQRVLGLVTAVTRILSMPRTI